LAGLCIIHCLAIKLTTNATVKPNAVFEANTVFKQKYETSFQKKQGAHQTDCTSWNPLKDFSERIPIDSSIDHHVLNHMNDFYHGRLQL
jgi:hypothetical protein